MAIGVATGAGGVAAAAVEASSRCGEGGGGGEVAASDLRADPALRLACCRVHWLREMRGSVRHRVPLGTEPRVHVVDPGPATPLTTQTPRAQTAQRGGVDGSVRPGLRPANLGRRLEPIRIRQVIRLAVPMRETPRCGLRLRVSAGIGPASPERGCVFSCGASKPRAGARRQRRP